MINKIITISISVYPLGKVGNTWIVSTYYEKLFDINVQEKEESLIQKHENSSRFEEGFLERGVINGNSRDTAGIFKYLLYVRLCAGRFLYLTRNLGGRHY